jgi:DNA helicase-2/ATP-dependent DNA helicase PcrA
MEIIDLLKGAMFDGGLLPKELPVIDARYLKAFAVFESQRADSGLRFFSDLIYDPVCAALGDDSVAARIGNRYDHVIIDEFQDINEAQMSMVRIVAGQRAQVLAVGDDDQTIYGWRGARADYMTHLFEKEFVGAKRYSISHTFRFGHGLSLLANHVIVNNKNRTDKLCVSAADHQTAIAVRMHTAGCGAPVIEEIARWRAGGGALSDIAILIRQYANSIPVEIALHQAGIPYRIVGAPPFVDRAEVIAIRGYLQLACGGFAGIADPGHLHKTISAMLAVPTLYLRRDQIEHLAEEAVVLPARVFEIISDMLRREQGIKTFTRDHRAEAMDNWRWCSQQAASMPAARFLGDLIRRTKLFDFIVKNNPRSDVADEKIRMIHQITDLAYAGRHTVQSFLALLSELSSSFSDTDESGERLLITSCHRAKGMEWPMVILPDLADGLFPHCTLESTEADVEDERRLFYVAVTRALNDLVVIAPLDRQLLLWSKESRQGHPPINQIKASRFLFEANLDQSVLAGDALASGKKPDGKRTVVTRRYQSAIDLAAG